MSDDLEYDEARRQVQRPSLRPVVYRRYTFCPWTNYALI